MCQAVSLTHSADVSFHVKPDSQAIASKFALSCLAQFPANRLDVVMVKMKILADKTFMYTPLVTKYLKIMFGHRCLKFQSNNCGEMTRSSKKNFKKN